jgi:hypothetical protein
VGDQYGSHKIDVKSCVSALSEDKVSTNGIRVIIKDIKKETFPNKRKIESAPEGT